MRMEEEAGCHALFKCMLIKAIMLAPVGVIHTWKVTHTVSASGEVILQEIKGDNKGLQP